MPSIEKVLKSNFMERTSQTIIPKRGHFMDRTFLRQDIYKQNISKTGHFIVRKLHTKDIIQIFSQIGHSIDVFIYRTFYRPFHTKKIQQIFSQIGHSIDLFIYRTFYRYFHREDISKDYFIDRTFYRSFYRQNILQILKKMPMGKKTQGKTTQG